MVVYDPQSFEESSHDPIWKTSMQEEFNSLQDNETQALGSSTFQEETSEM